MKDKRWEISSNYNKNNQAILKINQFKLTLIDSKSINKKKNKKDSPKFNNKKYQINKKKKEVWMLKKVKYWQVIIKRSIATFYKKINVKKKVATYNENKYKIFYLFHVFIFLKIS